MNQAVALNGNEFEKKDKKKKKYRLRENNWKRLIYLFVIVKFGFVLSLSIIQTQLPRESETGVNIIGIVFNVSLSIYAMYVIFKGVKTLLLFSSVLFFSFGLMYAYTEVLDETKNSIWTQEQTVMLKLLPPLTTNEYRMDIARKYIKILIGAAYIMLGVFLYQIRQLKVERSMGNLLNQDFRVIIQRVNSIHGSDNTGKSQQSQGVNSFYKRAAKRQQNDQLEQEELKLRNSNYFKSNNRQFQSQVIIEDEVQAQNNRNTDRFFTTSQL